MDLRNCKDKDFELQLLVRKRTHTCHAAAIAHSKQVNSADARSKYICSVYSCHSLFMMLRMAPLVYGYDQFYIGQYYSMVVVKKISTRRVRVTVNV